MPSTPRTLLLHVRVLTLLVNSYFEAAPRIAAPNYEPTEEDAIMTRVVTLGISTTVIDHPSGQFKCVAH